MNKNKRDEIHQLIDRVILDPILLRRLSDRVYELILEDVRNQRDRGNYRGSL